MMSFNFFEKMARMYREMRRIESRPVYHTPAGTQRRKRGRKPKRRVKQYKPARLIGCVRPLFWVRYPNRPYARMRDVALDAARKLATAGGGK